MATLTMLFVQVVQADTPWVRVVYAEDVLKEDDPWVIEPPPPHEYKFVSYKGDIIKIFLQVSSAASASSLGCCGIQLNTSSPALPSIGMVEILKMDESGARQPIFKKIGVTQLETSMEIYAEGVYVLTLTNTTGKKIPYSLEVFRYNPNPSLAKADVSYREKTVPETTWVKRTYYDTLGLINVDTVCEEILNQTVHLPPGGKIWLGDTTCIQEIRVDIPSIDFVEGYEPKIVFYAAHSESDRWLGDQLGNIALALVTGGLGFLPSIPVGDALEITLLYWSGKQKSWYVASSPSITSAFSKTYSYSSLPSSYMKFRLNNCTSTFTGKDFVVKVSVIKFTPHFNIQKREEVEPEVIYRKVPVIPEGK